MGDLGLLGITVDERYGGSAMGYLAHIIVFEEISDIAPMDYPMARIPTSVSIRSAKWIGKSKEKYLPDLCSGKKAAPWP